MALVDVLEKFWPDATVAGTQRWPRNCAITPGRMTAAPTADETTRGGIHFVPDDSGSDRLVVPVMRGGALTTVSLIPFGSDIQVVSNAAVVSLVNNVTTAQNIFPAATDVFAVEAATTYLMLGRIGFNTGNTDHVTSLGFALTTATLTSIAYVTDTISSAAATLATPQRKRIETNAATAVCATSTAVQTDITLSGIMRVNAAGSITPQVTFSAGPGGTCETDADSFLMFIKLGSNTFASLGSFS